MARRHERKRIERSTNTPRLNHGATSRRSPSHLEPVDHPADVFQFADAPLSQLRSTIQVSRKGARKRQITPWVAWKFFLTRCSAAVLGVRSARTATFLTHAPPGLHPAAMRVRRIHRHPGLVYPRSRAARRAPRRGRPDHCSRSCCCALEVAFPPEGMFAGRKQRESEPPMRSGL